MIKRILKIAVLLLIAWIVYVQFWGTDDQKTMRKNLFESVRNTGKSIGQIAKSEKGKLKDVSFKDALSKVGDSLDKLKENTKNLGAKTKEKINKVEKAKEDLDNLLSKLKLKKDKDITEAETQEAEEKAKSLSDLMEELAKELETEETAP